jgi:hypothetical protein
MSSGGILKGASVPTHKELLEKLGATKPLYAASGTRFGPTTSSNPTNRTNYNAKHAGNNESQSRQSMLNAYNLPTRSYRPIGKYVAPVPLLSSAARNPERFENAMYARNLQAARVPSGEEAYITPSPEKRNPKLSPRLAQIYAQISANSNNPGNIERRITADATLNDNEKQDLIDKTIYEYNSNNLNSNWNKPAAYLASEKASKPSKSRKSRKSRKTRKSRATTRKN